MPVGEDVDMLLLEEVVDIGDVSAEEVQRVRVVVLNWLRHIDDINLILPIEHVVLAQVRVDQFALLIEHSHYLHHLQVDLAPPLDVVDLCVLEAGSIFHVLSDEVHDEDVWLDEQAHGR